MLPRTIVLLCLVVQSLSLSHKPAFSSKSDSYKEWTEKVQKVESLWNDHPDEVDKWMEKWEAAQTPFEIPEFKCAVQEPGEPPESVHMLRPGDIKVIAAFGDSVTAGNGVGADTLPGVAIENRGESWSIGVNDTIESVLTVANLIREFNPDLVGGSYSRTGRDDDRNRTHCSEIMNCAQLNVAVPGATNRDMVEQAQDLVQKIQDHPDIDLANDWKLMTLFIGGNDLCAVCRRWDVYNPEYYTNSIKQAIETIKADIPRVMFQVVTMFDITPLANMSDGIVCDLAQMGFCDCALYNETTKDIVKNAQYAYWELLDELININGTYDGDESFTVILQPHMRDLIPPFTEDGDWDRSYMAPDCFHPNLKGHQSLAYQLWNTMLTPVPDKPFVYPKEDVKEFYCPSEEAPYIFTNDNSRVQKKTQNGNEYDSKQEWNKNLKNFENWLDKHPDLKEKWLEEWENQMNDEFFPPPPPPFTCDVVGSEEPPTSVHQLRPSDINVMASFGDSITAGNGVGATTLPGVAIENRGESWCIGGNMTIDDVLTVPNILKEFNPNLVGWSYSRPGIGGDRNKTHCGRNMECAQLNLADPGGTNRDMPPQAIEIVQRMRDHPDVDMDNDWKIITLFIGGNDLCAVCRREEYLPKNYLANIKTAIETIKADIPRTLLQVVAMFDVTPLQNMSRGLVCDAMHINFCDCAVHNDTVQSMIRPVQLEYWRLLDELINVNGTYDGDDSFTVVLQPHMRDLIPPTTEDGDWDKSYLSPDCFHPNSKGHHHMAYQLWNVMLTPVQDKPFVYPRYDIAEMEFVCPTEEAPFIFTNDNSASFQKQKAANTKNKEKHIVDDWNENYRKVIDWLESEPEIYQKQIEQWSSKVDEGIQIPSFTCDVAGGVPPTSVHELRPGDIDVIAAMGDSVTAGYGIGAETMAEVSIQKRGESWTVGGNQSIETVLTVGNLFKSFNPDLVGWSYNRPGLSGNSNDTGCTRGNDCSQFNVALGGATSPQMPNQAEMLVERMTEHPDVDFQSHWKLITLFIGGNDLCRVCNDDDLMPNAYINNIKTAIEIIRTNIPRVLMQVVPMFDITPLTNMSTGPACDAFQRSVCSCVTNDETRPILKPIQMEYWRLLDELIVQNRTYDGDNSFTVVLQPHMRDLTPPITEDGEWDTSYFAPDCFHPNRKSHQYGAYQLWNVMLTPVSEKPFNYDQESVEDMVFKCPTEEAPYIFTNDNSASFQKQKATNTENKEKNSFDDWNENYRKVTDWLESEPEIYQKQIEQWSSKVDEGIQIPPFTCDVEGGIVPATSVHELRPGDIDVIAAMGDSITAGYGIGAETMAEVSIQKRGESWSVGGNQSIETVLTVGNLIKSFNPNLVGWSYNRPGFSGNSNDTGCTRGNDCSQLNVALGGATAPQMPNQAEMMVERMTEHPNVDFQSHWKLITLFIGGNDLCRVCFNDDLMPDAYLNNIKTAIEIIRSNIPRVLMQVIPMFDITPLTNMSTGPACDAFHSSACNCAINDETRPTMRPIQMEYWRLLDELIVQNRTYDGDDSFTVVLQPHMRDLTPPITEDGEWDTSYFAPDCFHPNRKGHQYLAYQLWNVMLTPVSEKPFDYDQESVEDMVFKCPSEESPYISTNDNSLRKTNKLKKNTKKGTKPTLTKHPKNVKAPAKPELYAENDNHDKEKHISSGQNSMSHGFIASIAGIVGVAILSIFGIIIAVQYYRNKKTKPFSRNGINYSTFDNPTYDDAEDNA